MSVRNQSLCTLNIIGNNSQCIYSSRSSSLEKGYHRTALSSFATGGLLFDRFSYQSEEGKEDGQLFLCRAKIVDYIHLKDSGA